MNFYAQVKYYPYAFEENKRITKAVYDVTIKELPNMIAFAEFSDISEMVKRDYKIKVSSLDVFKILYGWRWLLLTENKKYGTVLMRFNLCGKAKLNNPASFTTNKRIACKIVYPKEAF